MVPVIAGMGTSFKGAFLYYCHDKDARTTMRVAWTETRNLMADTVDKAWRFMAYTAKSRERLKQAAGVKATGRKLEKPVFTYSLSWHPEQSPTKREMLQAADDSLKALGLEEHQVIISCHRDEPHSHVHLIVNRTHPLTGIAAKLSRSKRKLSDFARVFQRKEGTDYCPAREENYQKRKAGKRTKYGDPVIVNAWANSNSGKEFMAALEAEGYALANGNRRLVVVDRYGKAINPVRQLEGVKAKEFNALLGDLDLNSLPDASTLQKSAKNAEKEKRAAAQRKREELEERKALMLAALQDRQIEERSVLFSKHHTRIENAKAELSDFYALTEQKEGIRNLNIQLKKMGLFGRLFRRHRKIEAEKAAKLKTLENAQMRFNEAIGSLETKRDRELEQLSHKQSEQVRKLTLELDAQFFEQEHAPQRRSRNQNTVSREIRGP